MRKTENWTVGADAATSEFLRKIGDVKGLSKSKSLEFCINYTKQNMNDDDRMSKHTAAIRADIKSFYDEFSELKIDLDKALA